MKGLQELCEMYGLVPSNNKWGFESYTLYEDTEKGTFTMSAFDLSDDWMIRCYLDGELLASKTVKKDPMLLIKWMETYLNKYTASDIFECVYLEETGKYPIAAAISTRELTKNMVRVKSSNLWGMAINIKNKKDRFGDMIIQFKSSNVGGPGDVYQYFDVPVKLYRTFVGAPSKGAFFWRYIRNNFKYRKLTGNRRGVLPNALN